MSKKILICLAGILIMCSAYADDNLPKKGRCWCINCKGTYPADGPHTINGIYNGEAYGEKYELNKEINFDLSKLDKIEQEYVRNTRDILFTLFVFDDIYNKKMFKEDQEKTIYIELGGDVYTQNQKLKIIEILKKLYHPIDLVLLDNTKGSVLFRNRETTDKIPGISISQIKSKYDDKRNAWTVSGCLLDNRKDNKLNWRWCYYLLKKDNKYYGESITRYRQ